MALLEGSAISTVAQGAKIYDRNFTIWKVVVRLPLPRKPKVWVVREPPSPGFYMFPKMEGRLNGIVS